MPGVDLPHPMSDSRTMRGEVFSAVLLLVGALLACKSPHRERCMSALEYQGVRHSSIGSAASKDEARESSRVGTCMAYCQYSDPAIDQKWNAWKATPEGQKSRAGKTSDIYLHFKGDKEACEERCERAMEAGSASLKTECL